jgi:two-component system OmpR family response regulator
MHRPDDDKRATILVVDDDRALRTLAATALRSAGYRVITAGDGDEALHAIEGTQVRLIVSDVAMPGLDGRELAHALWERRRHIPILYMSAHPQQPALLPGAFLPKPFRFDDLITQVRELLAR